VVDSAVGKSLFLDRLALVVSEKTRHPFFQPLSKHSKKKGYISFISGKKKVTKIKVSHEYLLW